MPITAEQLIFELTAKVTGFEDEMTGAAAVFNKAAASIEGGFSKMNKQIADSSRQNASNIKAMTAAIAGAISVREVIGYADAWKNAGNALVAAKVPANEQADVLERLFKQSQDYSVELNAQVDLYSQVSRAAAGLTSNGENIFRFTEAVAAGLKADGKSATDAAGPLLQLGQALRSPVIQAEEFNSLIDGAPSLLQAAANGIRRFNGDLGALIAAAKGGKLSSKEFFDGILAGSDELKSRVGQSADTFENAFQRIENALTRYIGQTDDSLGASQRLIAGLNAFADDFDDLADTAVWLASVIAGALVGRAIGGAIATIPIAIVAFKLLTLAANAAGTAAGFAAANFGAASRAAAGFALSSRYLQAAAVTRLLGPLGAIIGTIATMVALFVDFSDGANKGATAADAYAAALERVRGAGNNAAVAIRASTNALNERRKNDISRGIDAGQKDIEAASDAAAKYFQFIQDNAPRRMVSEDQLKQLADLSAALQNGSKSAEQVDNEIAALANSNPKFQNLANQLQPLLERLAEAVAAVKLLKSDLSLLGGMKPSTSPGAAGAVYLERQKRQDFLDERSADAKRSDLEKDIDTRSKAILAAATKLGITLTEAAARLQAKSELASESTSKSIDTSVSGYVDRVVGAESGGVNDAKNPMSSATGLGQFIESTWLDMFKKNFPDRAASMSREAILALRSDATISKQLIEAYARENAAILSKAGVSVDEAALHLAHFLGPDGAIKVLKAAPGTPIAGLLDPKAIAANKSILGNGATVDTVRGYAEQRAGMKTPGAQSVDAQLDFADTLKEHQKTIDAMKEETAARAGLNPLVDDYGRKLAELHEAQGLLNVAQKDGVAAGKELKDVQQLLYGDLTKLTPEARAQAEAMRAIALGAGQAAAAGGRLDASQQALQQTLQQSSQFGKDVFGGLIRDMRDGASAGEALHNVLTKVSDRLLDIGLNALFDGSKAGSGGGILGNLFGSLFKGFDGGGYTGPGGKHTPAGVVHKGEYVITKEDVDRMGVNGIESMLRGYANGGPVLRGPNMSSFAGLAGSGRSGPQSVTYKIDVAGAKGDREIERIVTAAVKQGIDHNNKTKVPSLAVKSVHEYQQRFGK